MRVKSSPSSPSLTRQQTFFRRSPIIFAIVLIFFGLSVVSKFIVASYSAGSPSSSSSPKEDTHNNQIIKMDQPTEKATDPIQLRLEYVQVPSGRDDVTRYKAMKSSSAPDNNESISIQSWMELVSSNTPSGNQAASDLTKVISSSPYASLMFETPGTSWEYSRDTPFEFALVNEPALQRFAEGRPDRNAFQEHFRGCLGGNNNSGDGIVPMCCSFGNLGGDARLVAPLPSPSSSSDATYSHLAIFVRNAPKEQVGEFWRLGASQYLSMLEEKHDAKTWFSTNGMGVAWLHLRLDSVPKYYSYRPFTAR